MKQRIITAIVLIIIVLPCVYLGGHLWDAFAGLASVLGLYEIMKLTNRKPLNYIMDVIVYALGIYLVVVEKNMFFSSAYFALLMVVLFALAIFIEDIKFDDIMLVGAFAYFCICGLHSLYYLRANIGVAPLLFIALATYGSDTGAYFTGVAIGKHKLIPRLSPKKTIEGSIGGIVTGTILATIYANFFPVATLTLTTSAIVAFVLTITAQIGDLTFSYLKRTKGIKDYSNLLPGHGGVLDRLDSLIFNALVFCLFLLVF